MFPVYGYRFTHLVERRSLIIVITWPAGLYINGELAQVQPEGLDLTSSILKSCSTCLQLNIFVAICMVYVYEIVSTNWSLKYGGILNLTDLWWRILPKLMRIIQVLETDNYLHEFLPLKIGTKCNWWFSQLKSAFDRWIWFKHSWNCWWQVLIGMGCTNYYHRELICMETRSRFLGMSIDFC